MVQQMPAIPISRPVKVLIVDDHPVFAEVLATILAPIEGFAAPATALNGKRALAELASGSFNLVLLDLMLPGMSGIELLTTINRQYPEIRVVICSGLTTSEAIETSFRLGAYSYVSKTGDVADVVAAIRGAADGKTVFDGQVADIIRQAAIANRQKKTLSPIDLEVLRRLAHGVATKVIADECNLSESAVYKAQKRIASRLDITSDKGLVAAAARFGLTDNVANPNLSPSPSPAATASSAKIELPASIPAVLT